MGMKKADMRELGSWLDAKCWKRHGVITPEFMLGEKHIWGKCLVSILDILCLCCAFDI